MILRLFLFTLILTGLSCTGEKGKLGSQNNPVKLYFTPSVDADTITTNSIEFIRFLEKETGLYFETGIPASFVAVVEALGSERADIAVMNSFGYIMANTKYGAQAKLTVVRHGSDSYRGQIITHVDSGINSVKDIEGKSFAFTDASSTSGYLFPLKILKSQGVRVGNSIFAMKHDNVVTQVYQQQVDAGATFYSAPSKTGEIRDARARVKTQFPDVEQKVKILELTDEIKNDPFVFRKDLPKSITNKVILAIKKFLSTPSGRTIFENIYSVSAVVDSTDADYDSLREMLNVLELKPEKMLKKK